MFFSLKSSRLLLVLGTCYYVAKKLTCWYFLADADLTTRAWPCRVNIIIEPENRERERSHIVSEKAIWRPVATHLWSLCDWETQLFCSLFALCLRCYPLASGSTCNSCILCTYKILTYGTYVTLWIHLYNDFRYCNSHHYIWKWLKMYLSGALPLLEVPCIDDKSLKGTFMVSFLTTKGT